MAALTTSSEARSARDRRALRLAATLLIACAVACGDDGDGGSGAGSGGGGNAGQSTGGTSGGGSGGNGGGAGNAGNGGSAGNAGGGAGGTGDAGGAAGTTGGGAGAAGTGGDGPKRPTNPRTDIGDPDGFLCQDLVAGGERCAEGEQCCSGSAPAGGPCVEPGAECGECTGTSCGVVTCDGPEDCPGELCCARIMDRRMEPCDEPGGMCPMFTFVAACEDRCEEDGTVLCEHPRDCLDDDTCNFNPLGPPFLPRCEAP